MKKVVWGIVTVGVILLVNWAAARLFANDFVDWLFLSGLAVTIGIHFFNSSGGFTSDLADSRLQGANNDEFWAATEVNTKLERTKRSFQPTSSFYVALIYTIAAGIFSLIYY